MASRSAGPMRVRARQNHSARAKAPATKAGPRPHASIRSRRPSSRPRPSAHSSKNTGRFSPARATSSRRWSPRGRFAFSRISGRARSSTSPLPTSRRLKTGAEPLAKRACASNGGRPRQGPRGFRGHQRSHLWPDGKDLAHRCRARRAGGEHRPILGGDPQHEPTAGADPLVLGGREQQPATPPLHRGLSDVGLRGLCLLVRPFLRIISSSASRSSGEAGDGWRFGRMRNTTASGGSRSWPTRRDKTATGAPRPAVCCARSRR